MGGEIMPESKLQMVFLNAGNKTTRMSIDDPKEDLTTKEVTEVMNNIISTGIFNSSGGDIVSIDSAKIITTQVEELEV